MNIEEFIGGSLRAGTVNHLFGIFNLAMKARGFEYLVFSLMTDHPSIGLRAQHAVLCSYPENWMRHYAENNYEKIDPVRNELTNADAPVLWASLQRRQTLTPEQDLCLREAEVAGLKQGIAIPLRGPGNTLAGLGAASRGNADLGPENLACVRILTRQFYDCYISMHSKSIPVRQPLTSRELQVGRLYSSGAPRAQIGAALGISLSGVKFHLDNIRVKMGTPTLRQAITRAQSLGLLCAQN
ncbi:MAG TPA: LuxR family transcriptional regulator [Patescibacteria group bacterium]|nr:LuxR family transcriptional regulator [Patescibacteria group bacterium]